MININIADCKNCSGTQSLFLTFPYDEKVVNVVRSLPSRFWDKEKKEWEVPFDKLSQILTQLSDYEFEITGTYKMPAVVTENDIDFHFKTSPFKHQIEGFRYGINHDRWLLADEQGLGKTKQVIDIAIARKETDGFKHCLIVCGVNGLKWNWVEEIATHSNEQSYVLGQRVKAGKTIVGSNADKLTDVKMFNKLPYFVITNVESLRDDEIASELAKLCKDGTINIVAIDEIHKCKNPASQQGKGILKLQPECRIAMTGTPVMNTPLDLYITLRWLGFEKHAFYSFRNHYAVMGGFGGYQVMGYKNLDELQDTLNRIMLRRLKSDVLDLPEKVKVNEYVEMTPMQAQIYREISMEISANIDQIKMSNNPLAELIRMRQATGYTGILSSAVQESAKLNRMEELVEEAVANGKKVVIFSNWTQMTDEVYKRLHPKYHPAIITGATDADTRQDEVWHFQNDDNCKVIVGTIGAMGTGITLTAGTVEIFLDEPWNRANKEQAEDRCHRVGTTESVTIYTLICKNTIDEKINALVENKGIMADALVDGKLNISKEELVDFLLN